MPEPILFEVVLQATDFAFQSRDVGELLYSLRTGQARVDLGLRRRSGKVALHSLRSIPLTPTAFAANVTSSREKPCNPLTVNLFQAFFKLISLPLKLSDRRYWPKLVALHFIVALAGCTTVDAPQKKISLPVPVSEQLDVTKATPALSATASAALVSAEKAVADARQQKALWARAAEVFTLAQDAARRFDSSATIKLANEARVLANLGLAQKAYPPVRESITTK